MSTLRLVFLCFSIFGLCSFLALASPGNLFAFSLNDRAYITSTSSYSSGGVSRRDDIDWIRPIGSHTLIGFNGDNVDCEMVCEEIESINRMHEQDFNGRSLSCDEVATLCRSIIAKNLRKDSLQVDVIVAGWDVYCKKSRIYWLDRIGSMKVVPYAAHGRDMALVLGILDRMRNTKDDSCNSNSKSSSQSEETANKTPRVPPSPSSVGLGVVRAAWQSIEKRALTKVGRFRLKSVDSAGGIDHGMFASYPHPYPF